MTHVMQITFKLVDHGHRKYRSRKVSLGMQGQYEYQSAFYSGRKELPASSQRSFLVQHIDSLIRMYHA